ncbi:MAG: hybrid sensor histidine kinase/response regulator [Verrucomicrobia bacterium]|nr:hybrid sensor histidine kinase/response regulator [Verrucomicrobiota bacterium]
MITDESIDISNKVLLVIDDSLLDRKLISKVLERQAFKVFSAASGEEGISMIESVKPDLILLDIVMDGMDGLETCQILKKMPECQNVAIIFVTEKTDSDTILQAFSEGASDYITKPYRIKEAMARIETHLKVRSLLEQHKEFIKALTKANTDKSKFLGIASHDLKNPLITINGMSSFLVSGKFGALSSTQAEMVASIFEASEAMLALVNDLFDVALIETGQLNVEIDEVDLHSLVKTSVNLYRVTADKKDIAIEFVEKDVPEKVLCDKRQFRRVMDNLLSNAIKFSESGTTISVVLESDQDWVFFRVADEGPGIPEDEFDKLFGSFSKTSVKPTGGETSTGLGLNICKQVMQAHGGYIFAENLPEKGAQFSVQLQNSAVC